MNRDTYNKPSRLVPVFLVAALAGCLIPAAPAGLINPDPGGAQVTAFALGQVPPAGSSYDPLVKLPGTDTYELIPDRTGMITLSAQITHDFNGTITSAIKDADGVAVAGGTGTSPTFAFPPLKYRFPLVWTITSAEGDLMFGTLLILGHGGGGNGPGFIGGGRVTTETVPVSDEEITIEQYSDEGSYGEGGRKGRGGACGSCNSCDLTNSDETETVDAGGTAGMFIGGFSAGTSKQGDSKTGVDVVIDPTVGVSISSFKSFGSGDAFITTSGGNLQSIATDSSYVSFNTTALTNGVKVDISKTSVGTAYRTIKFENTATNQVTRTSTYDGKSIVTVWTYDSTTKEWAVVTGNGARKYTVTRTDDGTDPAIREERHKHYERAGTTGTAAVLVSEVKKTFTKTILGWRQTRSEVIGEVVGEGIEEKPNPLVTTWGFYGADDGALKAGLLSSITYPDGRTESHDYFVSRDRIYHDITRPFADAAGADTEVERRRSYTETGERSVFFTNGSTYKSQTRTWNGASLSEMTFDGAGYLTRNSALTSFGTDFGGKPTRVDNPDGTVNTQSISRSGEDASAMRNLIVERGVEGAGGIGEGVQITATRDSNAVLVSKYVTAIGTGEGTELERVDADVFDSVGRPKVISFFRNETTSAYTIKREYACCGLEWEQDRYGIKTYFAHDDLGRRIKTNRLDVTHATVYDGLTVHQHRYHETGGTWGVPAADSNEISNITRDVAGTVSHSWERSPQTEAVSADGDPPGFASNPELFTISTIQYLNGAADPPNPHDLPDGVGMRRIVNYVEVSGDGGAPEQQTDYYLDGRLRETSGDMGDHVRYSYEVTSIGLKSTREYVDGGTGKESVATQYDKAGRTKTVTQDGNVTTYTYGAAGSGNGAGKLVKVEDGDGVTTLYGYNAEGQRELTVLDLDGNKAMTPAIDRYTLTTSNPGDYNNHQVITTETTVFPDGATYPDGGILVSRSHSAVDGLGSWNIRFPDGANLTTSSLTNLSATAGSWTETTTEPDGTHTIASYVGGLPITTCHYASGGVNPITTITYDYGTDGLNRLTTTNDSRTGDTRTAYLSATCDAVKSVTEENGDHDRVTAFTYDHRGRRLTVEHPDGSITTSTYTPQGQVEATWGSLAYATVYTYDYAGRMLTLRTSPTLTGGIPQHDGGAVTFWRYDPDTGLLTGKFHNYKNDNLTDGPTYDHTPGGRLQTRTWKRGVTTDYHYNHGGQLLAVNYSDPTTPDVLYTRDRLGRVKTAVQGTMSLPGGIPTIATPIRSVTNTYDDDDFHLAIEALDYGDSFTKTLNRNTDPIGRLRSLEVAADYAAAYGYDTAGRLQHVHPAASLPTDPADSDFTYGYRADSYNLVETVTGPAHTVTNTWEDTRDVLATKENKDIVANPDVVRSDFVYTVNAIGQREKVSRSGTEMSAQNDIGWRYNGQGELRWEDYGDNYTPDPTDADDARDRVFQYDDIGNREKTASGTLTLGAANYAANPLNQYTTANGVDLTANGNDPYDDDGNYISGPLPVQSTNATLVWDAENRLIEVTTATAVITYDYDSLSRRIGKTVDPTTGDPVTTRYIYDGWNLIAEYSGQTLEKTYLWGMDLSGSMQGAGGVGGLLAVSEHSWSAGETPVDTITSFYPTFDGNGNVSEYLNGSGEAVAHYEYDAFGNTVATLTNGEGANINKDFSHRFSTKPLDLETGLYYYGYRWYDPLTGRWPSRDPIEERGGLNLYGFVRNDSIRRADLLGMLTVTISLTRNSQGWFAIYGDLSANVDDEKTAECCGFPLQYKTLESPGVTLKPPGRYVPSFAEENSASNADGNTSIRGKYNYGINHGYWTNDSASLPQKPEDMSQEDYDTIIDRELHSETYSALNIHFGPNTNHSTGCVLIGTRYILTPQVLSSERSDRFDRSLTRDVPYYVPGFDLQDSINSQFRLFSAINCAQKRGAQLRYVVTNSPPARADDIEDAYHYSPGPPGQPPRAIPINDSFAFD